jgi:hypothetical protein
MPRPIMVNNCGTSADADAETAARRDRALERLP